MNERLMLYAITVKNPKSGRELGAYALFYNEDNLQKAFQETFYKLISWKVLPYEEQLFLIV